MNRSEPDLPPLLTAEAMRAADQAAIEDYGLPGFTLMETAGRAAADAIEQALGAMRGKTVCCLCGTGNNGGDGLVVARVLLARGARVQVLTLAPEHDLAPDAAHNLRLLQTLARHTPPEHLSIQTYATSDDLDGLSQPDVLVDALLGTGLTRSLREPVRHLVGWMNRQTQPTVALDVPTGLHSDTGTVLGAAVTAVLTVTMGAAKVGLFLNDGPAHAGQVATAEIGIPAFVLEQAARRDGCARRITDEAVRRWLPDRTRDAHKYNVGMALVVAGSAGMTGAPVMAATAAARIGAGAVVCACPETVQPTVAGQVTEVMTLGLPTEDGDISAEAARGRLQPRLQQARALLVGCGLGRGTATQAFVRTLLAQTDLPTVVDADGLYALAGHMDHLAEQAGGRWILTPHAGEFRRLAGDAVDLTDAVAVARTYAQRWNAVLILKGRPSVAATPDGTVYLSTTGSPALATAGTGDVLAGCCAGLLAQGLRPDHAAAAALHISGAAADRYTAHRGARSMMATDLLSQLPYVLHERFH